MLRIVAGDCRANAVPRFDAYRSDGLLNAGDVVILTTRSPSLVHFNTPLQRD